jgi:hypothetical protein
LCVHVHTLPQTKPNQTKQNKTQHQTRQERVHRSTRVWTLYLDLEESLGTLETTKAAYDRCLALKVRPLRWVLGCLAPCSVVEGSGG